MFSFNLNAEIEYISKKALAPIAPIAQKYDIECNDEFYKLINNFAHVRIRNKTLIEDRPRMKATKKTLGKVKAQAKKLADTIDGLNEIEKTWLWKGQNEVRNFHKNVPELEEHEQARIEIMGSPIKLEGLKNRGYKSVIMDEEDIRAALNVIQNFAQHGMDGLPKSHDGRKKPHGLRMLILNIQIYWMDTLGRPFTFDEHNSEGLTEAYEFCRDISQALDPSITTAQIKWQMRKIITDLHKK